MDLTASYATQLGLALGIGLLFFTLAYSLPARPVLGFLIVLIPFQLIDSRYGSLNVVLTYLIGFAFLLKRRLKNFPAIGIVSALFVLYLLSMFQTVRAIWFDHLLHIVSVGSGFLLFYLVYNSFVRNLDIRYGFKLLVIMNILVIGYSAINLTVGFDRFVPLGIREWAFTANVEGTQRLAGAFGAPGITAEFYALQCLILAYAFVHARKRVQSLTFAGLIAANAFLIIASGSRGSFLVMLGAILLFFLVFRKELGAARITRYVAMGVAGLFVAAVIVATVPQFASVFDRFTGTEFESYVPETRQRSFEIALERIPDGLILGHGPRLRLIDEARRRIPGYESMPAFPHNLYLHLLYTLGIPGLILYMAFFWRIGNRMWKARGLNVGDPFRNGMPKLGVLVLMAFLVDQLKIEFLRTQNTDIQHYLFTLWAFTLAASDRLRLEVWNRSREAARRKPRYPVSRPPGQLDNDMVPEERSRA